MIRTTVEHPFYVQGKGWRCTGELQPGDVLRSHDGQWLPVEEVIDNGEQSVVYNLRVSDYHTYFVGSAEWGFSVWAHNACQPLHHYVPVFMGSLVRRGSSMLTPFLRIGHTAIHRALNRFLKPLGMAPSSANPGWLIRLNFPRPAQRLAPLVEFYQQYQGGAHLQAFVTELLQTIRAGKFK